MSRKLKILSTAILGVVLTACASFSEQVDLAADRDANLKADLERLSKVEKQLNSEPLTLNRAIEVALNNNLELRVAEYRQAMKSDDAYAARLEMLPDLNLSARAGQRDRNRRQDYIDRDTGEAIVSNSIGSSRRSMTADLSLTWSVLDFGMSYVRARQASLQVKTAELDRLRQAQLLALEVTEQYWRAALAEDALDYIRVMERELGQQKAMIEQSVRERRMNPIAAKDISRRLVDLQVTIRDLQAEVSTSRVELARLMGLKRHHEFKMKREAIRPLIARLPRPSQLNVHKLEDYALHHRHELFKGDLNEKIRKDDVKAEMLSMFPDLSFGIGAHYDDNSLLYANNWNTAAVNFGWNLLSLPTLKKRMDAREDAVEMSRYERMQTTVGVLTQVHLALLDYSFKADRFSLLDESYSLANDLLGMVKEHNRMGKVSDLSVTERLLEDVAAKMKRDRSVVDVLVGYRRMLASIGLDVNMWETDLASIDLSSATDTSAYLEPRRAPAVQQPSYEVQTLAPQQVVQTVQLAQPVVVNQPYNQPTYTTVQPAYTELRSEPSSVQSVNTADYSRGNWGVQLAASNDRSTLQPLLDRARRRLPTIGDHGRPLITAHTDRKGETVYRARYQGYSEPQARNICNELRREGMSCWVSRIAPGAAVIGVQAQR